MHSKRPILFFAYFVAFVPCCLAFINITQAIFEQKMKLPNGASEAKTMLVIARSFEEQPYQGSTLEQIPEKLICNLQTFDCATFVENILALTLTKYTATQRFIYYQQNLQKLRYRNNKIDDYASRLHYFLEWKFEAEKNKLLRDITKDLGGEKVEKKINFMTSHRNLYPAMVDSLIFQKITRNEIVLNQKEWFYLPKTKIEAIEKKLEEGDIVAFTSAIDGLDFNHEGFVIFQNNRPYLLHASSEFKKVTISKEPIAAYLQRIKKDSGIVVLRWLQ